MIRRDNSLRSDATRFAIMLPPEDLGSVGFRFVRATIDPKVGQEVCLVLTEEAQYIGRYEALGDFDLDANSGTIETPNGQIGAIVWRVAKGTPAEAYIEQFLSPGAPATRALLDEAARQTRLKLIILDNRTSQARLVADFQNVFKFEDLVTALDALRDGWKPEEFGEARLWAKQNGNLIAQVRKTTLN